MLDADGDVDRAAAQLAFRGSYDQTTAENFSGAFPVQLDWKKEPHFNRRIEKEGMAGAKQETRRTDVLEISVPPFSFSPDPVPDLGFDSVPPSSREPFVAKAQGLIISDPDPFSVAFNECDLHGSTGVNSKLREGTNGRNGPKVL
jgi:hypothetical protein